MASTALDAVVTRLSEATPEDNPFSALDDPDLGLATAQICQGLVAYVAAARKPGGPGYNAARQGLDFLIAFLPPEEEDGLANMIHAVKMGLN
jgi:hypothetical protein